VSRRVLRLAAFGGALIAAAGVAGGPGALVAAPQVARTGAERLAGLEWTFVRIRYSSPNSDSFRARYWSEPWAVDAPAAEQNLSRRLRSVTSLQVNEPIVLTLDSPELWTQPWIYFVEPGNLALSDTEAATLREYLLRGGTATFDDFHGPYEWAHLEQEVSKVFPDRRIVELTPPHPVYSCFYRLEAYPQIPGLGSFMQGRTWEKGGFDASLHAVLDDRGRPMMLINWNTDMGDGWEWSNAEQYPGYIRYTAEAYRMMINEIVYTLTH
jgi:hypothetical protein